MRSLVKNTAIIHAIYLNAKTAIKEAVKIYQNLKLMTALHAIKIHIQG